MKLVKLLAAVASGAALASFAEDGYLQSTGVECVTIPYYVNAKTRIVLDYQLMQSGSKSTAMLSNRGSDATGDTVVWWINGNGNAEGGMQGKWTGYLEKAPNAVRRKVEIDLPSQKFTLMTNETTIASKALSVDVSTPCSWPLSLFGERTNDVTAAALCSKIKVYSLKIYEGDDLKFDGVPCARGKLSGLYDNVSRKLYADPQHETLTTGGDVMTVEEPYVDSIGGADASYVNLGYYPNAKTKLTLDYQILVLKKTSVVCGTNLHSEDGTGFGLWVNSGQNHEAHACGVWSGYLTTKSIGLERATAILDNASSTAKGMSKKYDLSGKTGYDPEKRASTNPLCLFGDQDTTDGVEPARVRFYSMTIEEDGVVVHRYLPHVRNGVVGVRDSLTGDFFTLPAGAMSTLTYGGAIDYDGGAVPEAFVQSDGTQFVSTGVRFTPQMRVEADYQYIFPQASSTLFGAWTGCDAASVGFWRNASGNAEFKLFGGKKSSGADLSTERLTAVVDATTGEVAFGTWSGSVTKQAFGESAEAIGVFGAGVSTNGACCEYKGSYRVYALRIYESGELTHEFLPYADGDTVGLRDTKTGEVKTNLAEGANALKVGGIGAGGAGDVCTISPANLAIASGESRTLTASAVGAVSYRWACDGQVIDGETGASLTVTWRKPSGSHVYSATPVYSVYGWPTDGQTVSTTVTFKPNGLLLIFR